MDLCASCETTTSDPAKSGSCSCKVYNDELKLASSVELMTRHPSLQVCCVTERKIEGTRQSSRCRIVKESTKQKGKRNMINENVTRIDKERVEGYEDARFTKSCQLARGNG